MSKKAANTMEERMKSSLTKVSLALLSAVFFLGCQDMGSGPVGPDGWGPQFTHNDPDKVHGGPKNGGGGDDGTKVSWSLADHVVPKARDHDDQVPDDIHTVKSTCSGAPGKPSNPSVEWKDDEVSGVDGCVTVTTTGGVKLTNDAYLIVATKKGDTQVTLQFQIQDIGGADGIQYRTDRFFIDSPVFTGAGFTLHVHSTVDIYELKGHTGGPKVKMVGTINIGDIEYH